MIHDAIMFYETPEKNKQVVSKIADQDTESVKGVYIFIIKLHQTSIMWTRK